MNKLEDQKQFNEKNQQDLIAEITWNEQGLITAIAQDMNTNEVLMLAWMNKESLLRTIDTNQAWYWSRSRKKFWRKGEESGNTQKIVKMYLDCDSDAVLLMVKQTGVACHTGRKNCFFKQLV